MRVGEARWRVRAAGRESRGVRGALGPGVVRAQAVRLVRRVAGLQVRQRGQHGGHSGGGHVHRGASGRVHVVPRVVRVMGLVGGQGQALVHVGDLRSRRGDRVFSKPRSCPNPMTITLN